MKDEKKETQAIETEEIVVNEVSKEELEKIVRRHVYGSMAVGLVPIPLADFAAVTGIQLNMLRMLAKKYNVPFSKGVVKNILSSLVGGAVPAAVSFPLAASIAKFVPVIGQTVGVVTMPLIGGATTYAVGRVFAQHFASGGTFLTFNPEKARDYYQKMFKEGKKVATEA